MYEWMKALHVISVIAWMAGLFYLPRLFVYHCQAKAGSEQSELFKVMERRLLRAIMNPAMIATWAFGLYLAVVGGWFTNGGWLHAKLALVVLMTVMHMAMARWRKAFEEDRNVHSEKFYRFANEGPTLLMIGIVILVIVKPF
ncbi:protoporphyrinogen oxidase HemJ [Aestuariispira ectoiniformans]|uniref:protoporphyrinogen oxidase HemJ n=1 Tax=Aestuariispira ectoiniformans TaxID=2775080 RepID=UPI00223AAAD2|nr:protoporphyrinogen oxidase HemJ [Aestuariispira ectoiniformans]